MCEMVTNSMHIYFWGFETHTVERIGVRSGDEFLLGLCKFFAFSRLPLSCKLCKSLDVHSVCFMGLC